MRCFFLFFALFLWTVPVQAALPEKHAHPEFLPVVSAVGDAQAIPVLLKVKLTDNWKTYWRTPGESGLAPVYDWSQSVNVRDVSVRYPPPFRFTTYDIDNYVYKHEVLYPLTVTPEQPGAAISLNLKYDILVCDEICEPETHTLSLDVPAGTLAKTIHAQDYDRVVATLPEKDAQDFMLEKLWLHADDAGATLLSAKLKTLTPVAGGTDLFVEHAAAIPFSRPTIEQHDGYALLHMTARVPESYTEISQKMAEGQATLTLTPPEQRAVEMTESIAVMPHAEEKNASPAAQKKTLDSPIDHGFLGIMLAAFLGGLILNLMPCVLPVLSLKVMAVVSHGGSDSRRDIFRSFMASSAGIVASFWILAGGLAALKAAGSTIGWGIQFQHPGFLIFLITILLFFALNMWGAFEVPLPGFIARRLSTKQEHESTLLGHFLTGMFATLLATPCTAPFLGTAVGFALARDAIWIFSIFTLIGLGLAFPYIVLAFLPSAFRYMPRPGAWMVKLKKGLAVVLLLTALWLVSVLVSITTTSALDTGWQTFDEALIEEKVDEGQVVFVDVTAEWCLTCKANKRLVLRRTDVEELLSGPEIFRMQADWTQRSDTIAAYLQRYGRYGIPFNIVYGPGAPEGIILPELLTRDAVFRAVAEAAGE